MIKSKKIIIVVILCILFVLCFFLFQPMNMHNVIKEPNFTGIVKEINESSILVAVNQDEDEFKSSDLINVSLHQKLEDGTAEFNLGDTVTVYYDGTILESYPALVNNVYVITLTDATGKNSK